MPSAGSSITTNGSPIGTAYTAAGRARTSRRARDDAGRASTGGSAGMAAATRTRSAARVIGVAFVALALLAGDARAAEPRPSQAAPPGATSSSVAAAAWTLTPYRGLGTWADVYDWSIAHGGGNIGPDDVDRMAAD